MLQDKCIVIIVFQGAVSEKMVSEYISYTDGPMTKIAEYVINEWMTFHCCLMDV